MQVDAHVEPVTTERRAAEMRASLEHHLTSLCRMMDEARRDGFVVSFSVLDTPDHTFALSIKKEF
jgi:hypothetical protein